MEGSDRRGRPWRRASFLLLSLAFGFLLGRLLREEPPAVETPRSLPGIAAVREATSERTIEAAAGPRSPAPPVPSLAPGAAPPSTDPVDRIRSPVRVAGESGDEHTGVVRVICTEPGGTPAPGREVSVTRWGGDPATAATDANGIADFPGLPLGPVTVTSKTPGWAGVVSAWSRPGRIVEVSLALGVCSVVEGRVADAAKGPLGGVKVVLVRGEGTGSGELTAMTDAEGRYRFDAVPEGRWTVRLQGDAVGFSRHSWGEITVAGGIPVERDFLVGANGLSGTVKDRTTGRPVTGVSVRIQSGGPFRMTDTDAGGRFRIPDVAPGNYGVTFYLDGYVQETVENVRVGAEGGALDAELTPTGTLVLLVSDAGGSPVSGNLEFTWVLRNDTRSPSWGTRRPADENGRVVLRTLAPGAYRMTVEVPGLGSRTIEVDLGQGETTVEVRLEKRP